MHYLRIFLFAAFLGLLSSSMSASSERPNIIVILCDDAGFADFGCFGGISSTPNIDQLANEGMRFTRAYSNARCMPTRLSLLTGLPPQLADFKLFTEMKGNCVTIAEVLKEIGYATYMLGKWHMGLGSSNTQPTPIPSARGFDRFYGIWEGAAQPRKEALLDPNRGNGEVRIIEDGVPIPWEELPEDYYVTFTWNDKAIEMINETPEEQPFFMYFAHTAPHWPIDPFQSYIDAYSGHFDAGWDAIRDQIFQNQKNLGLFPPSQTLSSRDEFYAAIPYDTADSAFIDSYRSSSEKYYAAVTEMDDAIGWLMDALETAGRADNTLVIFLSDNGADAVIGGTERGMVSNTPFAGHKLSYFEGGIATPMIAWWPGKIPANTINTEHVIHLEDFMSTFLEITDATYPEVYNGYNIFPLRGRSFLSAMMDPAYDGGPRYWHWEHDAQRGVLDDPWKAVFVDRRHPVPVVDYAPEANGWRLYNLETDRGESNPLAEFTDFYQPGATPTAAEQRLLDMIQSWKDWASSVGWEPTGRWVEDNPLDQGFRGTDGTTERATPESYERFQPMSSDWSNSSLIQVFGFDQKVFGPRRLAFQAVSPTNSAMSVSIYGSTSFPEISETADDNPLDMPDNVDIPALGTLLSTFDFGGSTFDWSQFTHAFDSGSTGFSHLTLVFQLGDVNQELDSTEILPVTFADWKALNFSEADQADDNVSGPNAVAPAGDATNFQKYLSGRSPNQRGGSQTVASVIGGEVNIAFDALPRMLDQVNVLWDQSSDLENWNPATPQWFGLSNSGAQGRDQYRARFDVGGATTGFYRATLSSIDGDIGGDTGSRMSLVNGAFDVAPIVASGWAIVDDHADAGWVLHSDSRWNYDPSGFLFADNSGGGNVAQILSDNNLTQGDVTLGFDALNTVSNDILRVYVYGVREAFWINFYDENGPKIQRDSANAADFVTLVDGQTFGAIPALERQEITFTVPAGGFLYYAILFRTQGVVSPAVQQIDNVTLE